MVQNRKENCHHDHIPFNLRANRNIVFPVYVITFVTLQSRVTQMTHFAVFPPYLSSACDRRGVITFIYIQNITFIYIQDVTQRERNIFGILWIQNPEFRLVLILSEKCNCNPNIVLINKFPKKEISVFISFWDITYTQNTSLCPFLLNDMPKQIHPPYSKSYRIKNPKDAQYSEMYAKRIFNICNFLDQQIFIDLKIFFLQKPLIHNFILILCKSDTN